jgi:hypothetical protein
MLATEDLKGKMVGMVRETAGERAKDVTDAFALV